jgi:hypothetical protein
MAMPRLLVLFATFAPMWAHDIAGDVKVQAYLKPEAQAMRVVLRVPLKAMRDIEFPQRGSAFLDVEKADRALRDSVTMWISSAIEVYENDARASAPRLAGVKASLESDRSFVAYRDALSHVLAESKPIGDVPVEQVMLDAVLEYPIRSEASEFSIRPKLDRLGMNVVTVLWFLPPQGTVRAFEYTGDAGLVRLDPRWHQAALTFVRLGFFHILDGTDHLLFLFCLVIPFRQLRQLLMIVTSFTVAHSITLIASAFGVAPSALWFPPLIETLIAASIVYMALENIVATTNVHRRWIITFGFGLVHGFGFSFALHETLQFAGSHLVTSLLAFNVGVELGQVLVLLVLVPLLALLFRYALSERIGTIILSALVAHTGWHWMLERWDVLRKF